MIQETGVEALKRKEIADFEGGVFETTCEECGKYGVVFDFDTLDCERFPYTEFWCEECLTNWVMEASFIRDDLALHKTQYRQLIAQG